MGGSAYGIPLKAEYSIESITVVKISPCTGPFDVLTTSVSLHSTPIEIANNIITRVLFKCPNSNIATVNKKYLI